jgi:hypothetical protein
MKRREFLYGVGAVGAGGISYRFAPASVDSVASLTGVMW